MSRNLIRADMREATAARRASPVNQATSPGFPGTVFKPRVSVPRHPLFIPYQEFGRMRLVRNVRVDAWASPMVRLPRPEPSQDYVRFSVFPVWPHLQEDGLTRLAGRWTSCYTAYKLQGIRTVSSKCLRCTSICDIPRVKHAGWQPSRRVVLNVNTSHARWLSPMRTGGGSQTGMWDV